MPAKPEPWCRGITPLKAKQIKCAVEATCELCHEYTPFSLLELHGIPAVPRTEKPLPKERECHIIVVCSACHQHIHELPVPDEKLKALIEKRPFALRKEIRRILGYVPKPYSPQDDIDFSLVFDETLRSSSAGYYR
jgi:hypothetical protein